VWNVIFILRLPLQAAELGNQFYENMKLYEPSDRSAIEWGLKRIFDYDKGKINRAITAQVSQIIIAAQVRFGLMSVQADRDSRPSIYPCFFTVSLPVNYFADTY
jgi:hypothetical protein